MHAGTKLDVPVNPRRFLVVVLQPYRWHFAVFFAISAVGIIAYAASPFVVRVLINGLVDSSISTTAIWWLVGLFGLLRLMTELFWGLADGWVRGFLPQLREGIRQLLFTAVLRKRHMYFTGSGSGQVVHWIDNAATACNRMAESTLWTVWNRCFGFVIAVIFLVVANWLLALVFAVWVVVLIWFVLYRGRQQAILEAEHYDSVSRLSGQIADTVSNNLAVRTFTARKHEASRLEAGQRQVVRQWRQAWWHSIMTNAFKGYSAALVSVLTLALVVMLYQAGKVGLGDIALLVAYTTTASETIWSLSLELDSYFRNYGSLKSSLTGLLQAPDERVSGRRLSATQLTVSLRSVQFAYDGYAKKVFEDLDLEVPAGKKVGVVGRSGTGKTTLLGLLLGLYEPKEGKVLLNGMDIRSLQLDSVRRHIAFVPQDPHLFNRSIRENIAYGAAGDATDGEIRLAIQRAHALDFIESLPEGFDTVIGERGIKLSGGQKQRLAIARAMLSDAPLVLLDEATSALDSTSEQAIQEALSEVMKGRTALVVAHRLSTLKYMDRIVVIDGGKIVESGTHDELVAQAGIYTDLWRHQRDGFIGG